MAFHKDRDEETFNIYKMMYQGMPWSLFDFKNLEKDSNGFYVVLKKKEELDKEGSYEPGKYKELVEKYGGLIFLSGDADFGMKCGKSCTFKDETSYDIAEGKLKASPEEKMHEISNFSLLIVNAGMNSKKGFFYKDIFPRYLYALSKYYNFKSDDKKRVEFAEKHLGKICAGGRKPKEMAAEEYEKKQENLRERYYKIEIPALVCFLDSFGDFENYCIQTYFYGNESEEIKGIIKDLKEYGEKVNNVSFYEPQNIEEYCELAQRYWKIRNKMIEKKMKESKI